jgi:hypothetical protein
VNDPRLVEIAAAIDEGREHDLEHPALAVDHAFAAAASRLNRTGDRPRR